MLRGRGLFGKQPIPTIPPPPNLKTDFDTPTVTVKFAGLHWISRVEIMLLENGLNVKR